MAEKTELKPDYDAIIIGAGLGGLTVGNILVFNGYKTLIIDKNAHPGGYVINFQRGDFRFDSATHFINGCGKNGMVYNILKQFGAEKEIEFLPIPNLIHWKDPQNNYEARPPVMLDEYQKFLCEQFPNEAKNIKKFLSRYSKVMPTLFGFMAPGILKKIKTFIFGFPVFMRFILYAFKNVEQMIHKYFKDPRLIELLTLFVAPFGMTREQESFIIWSFNEFSYHVEGAWYPKGGAGAFTGGLAKHYEKIGGKFMLNTEVVHIDIDLEKRMAKAVICKDKSGKEIKLTSTIIVNAADLCRMATKLVPEGTFTQKWIHKLESRATIRSMFIIYLGLDIDIKDYGIDDYELWQLNSQWRTPENYENMYKNRDYSKLPMDVITFYSNGPDKTCCPPGKTVISSCIIADLKSWEELLEDGKKGERYQEFKKKYGWQFVDRLAELIDFPDLRKHVEVMEVATPITLRDYSYARNGTPIGYAFDLDCIKKTQFYGTRIKNLSLAGHFCFPSGGMSASCFSGTLAAKAAMKRLKKYGKK